MSRREMAICYAVCTMMALANTVSAAETPESGIGMKIYAKDLENDRAAGFDVVFEIKNGTTEPIAVCAQVAVRFEWQPDASVPYLGEKVDRVPPSGRYHNLIVIVRGKGDSFQQGLLVATLCDAGRDEEFVTIGPGKTASLGAHVQPQLSCVLVGAEVLAQLIKGVNTICESNKVTIRALRSDSSEQRDNSGHVIPDSPSSHEVADSARPEAGPRRPEASEPRHSWNVILTLVAGFLGGAAVLAGVAWAFLHHRRRR